MRLVVEADGEVAALVRATTDDSIVVILPATLDPLAMALARAAISPLAIERAPEQRINAICGSIDARDADIEAAIAFLDGARSTTGQILKIG